MRASLTIFVALVALATLASCQKNVPGATPGSTVSVQSSAVASQAPAAGVLSVEPAKMTACDPAAVATVKWDIGNRNPGVTDVELSVQSGNEAPKIFAAGGAAGQTQTGQWARPGTHFELKDKATGKLLDQISIQGPDCR